MSIYYVAIVHTMYMYMYMYCTCFTCIFNIVHYTCISCYQDALEFYHVLLTTLEEEMTGKTKLLLLKIASVTKNRMSTEVLQCRPHFVTL